MSDNLRQPFTLPGTAGAAFAVPSLSTLGRLPCFTNSLFSLHEDSLSQQHLLRSPRTGLSTAKLLKKTLKKINTKGFVLFLVLYLLRYPSFASASKKIVIIFCATIAICANFNLDLDFDSMRKGITVGLSRLVLAGTCMMIFRTCELKNSPFYCGVAIRVVPEIMFFVFKYLYKLLRTIACFFEQRQELARIEPSLGVEPRQCCICLENGCDCSTPCGHAFHRNCLSRWLEIKTHCPLCNQPVDCNNRFSKALRKYFILDYTEWKEMHSFLSEWWSYPVIGRDYHTEPVPFFVDRDVGEDLHID